MEIIKEYKDGSRIVCKDGKYDWQEYNRWEDDYIPFEKDLTFSFNTAKEARADYKGTMANYELWGIR